MNPSFQITTVTACLAGVLVACLGGSCVALADEPPSRPFLPPAGGDLNAMAVHPHNPVVIRSRPVIERLPVQVIEPVDLRVAKSGHIYVADSKAQCIFRLDRFSSVSLHAQQLPGICRICLDADESVYALTATSGESTIHQITPEGRHLALHTLPFPAHSFARVGITDWLVAEGRNLWSVNADSDRTLILKTVAPVLDLCTDAGGGTAALLADGHVLRPDPQGTFRIVGFAPASSKRLLVQASGQLAVLADASLGRTPGPAQLPLGIYPLSPSALDSPAAALARLPEGTLAAGFDALGNLCLANPQLRAVTKVTSRFRIPCPHCQESVLMIFDANAQPENIGSF
ncbi:MAG: hypothetical protein ACKO2P_21745 [Planctomycetota bacterium]